jgi:hypothetical protein
MIGKAAGLLAQLGAYVPLLQTLVWTALLVVAVVYLPTVGRTTCRWE